MKWSSFMVYLDVRSAKQKEISSSFAGLKEANQIIIAQLNALINK
jgi:hypothetical protein